ncbi:MAG: ribosome small subunit-dependent GTPase A [Wenzhouxiangellaceae bacterium]|nr:ribosome small subunit-dependent GTPase A [Wenzhouxiangellaceae bacterium]
MNDSWRVLLAMGNHGLAAQERHGGEGAPEPLREIRFRRRIGRPLPGDRVVLDEAGTVTEILPRHNVFGRGVRGLFQPMAANLDTLLVVIAPEPAPSPVLVDRYLAAARIAAIEPVLVINKCDLPLPSTAPFNALDSLNCPIHRTMALSDDRLDGLARRIDRGLHLLAGQSGVGKSTLANRLLPDLDQQTETLSRATGKGRHTTTHARLFRTPGGGWLADTPGVWEYGLWRMPETELVRAFPEFSGLPGCRFRDCRHAGEPGCAVEAATASGDLAPGRLDAWRKLLAEQHRLAEGRPE